MGKGDFSLEKVIRLLEESNGRARIEDIMVLAKRKHLKLDRTHIWDRLIGLSKKGLVINDSGYWTIVRNGKVRKSPGVAEEDSRDVLGADKGRRRMTS